jgi:hypothetical protein
VAGREGRSAAVRVLSGPAGSGKTTRLRQLWLERTQRQPGSALWLGPTRRAVEEVSADVLRQAGSLVGLRMMAFSDFLDDVVRHNDPGIQFLSDVQRRLLAWRPSIPTAGWDTSSECWSCEDSARGCSACSKSYAGPG